MRWVDLAGYIASSLVFMTFYMKGMVPLRLLALCSNVAFLFYACTLHLLPIMVLHGALIPVNVCRLVAARRDAAAEASARGDSKKRTAILLHRISTATELGKTR